MELRHDACGDESRDRHYRRWESLSAEMIHNGRVLTARQRVQEINVKYLMRPHFSFPSKLEIAFNDAPRTIAPASSDLQPAETTATLSELEMPLGNLIRATNDAIRESRIASR
jgi:hypothetical protein